MKNIIREIKDCHSVHINCCACGAREKVYFIPESIILKLEVGVAETETTTKENLAVGNYLAQTIAWGGAARAEPPEPIGNAAKMREALVQCELFLGNVSRHGHPTLNPGDKCTACDGTDELRGMVVRALAEPPRNCDVGTAEEQEARFNTFCKQHSKFGARGLCGGECPILTDYRSECVLRWAQMPYEEGENDEQ